MIAWTKLYYLAVVLLMGCLVARQPGEDLKHTLLRLKSFPGLQEQVVFDEFGDARSQTYITRIQDGKFVLAE